ncbi:uncharacterized protein LOC120210041 [Hibiscus syriacus]|uniref:uncharacterized protein LOC120210041 n=1 Tax=Hibiscus syriacus TaxID=106335 RepID=UPI001921B363|nr:uncharacterized protein LOC120210041 [Hibiscus syriacus]
MACYSGANYSIAFNGSLIGYFKGAKGLRQGNPLSPISFVMVMNILSKLLNNVAAKGIFSFHPKCKKICLIHLTFVDDLLIFYKGNLESVILKLNAAKCDIFIAGISVQSLDNIINTSGFKHGTLHVRYLGIPLVTRKLTVKDCQPLIDKIKFKLHQWQLILPQSIINKIKKICSRYFWKGSNIPAVGARVSWDRICKPKSEGGLGLNDIKSWNKTCMILLIKNLLAVESSLWVAWIHRATTTNEFWEEVRLKGSKVHWQKSDLVFTPHSQSQLDFMDARETKDHIFAECKMVASIWNSILQLTGIHKPPFTWTNLLVWAYNTWKGKSLLTSILKLS